MITYKGFSIQEGYYPNTYEAHNLSDCDQPMLYTLGLDNLLDEIDNWYEETSRD